MSILKNLGELAFNMAKAKAVDYIKDIQLKSEAAHLTDESRVQFHTGDLVRDDKKCYIVAKPRIADRDGILVALQSGMDKWYYRLTYCPYSKTVSQDGGCRLETKANDRTNGLFNTTTLLQLDHDLAYQEHNPYGCPPPIHRFPALEYVKKVGDDIYMPAIEELYDIFIETDIRPRLNEFIQKIGGTSIPTDTEVLIWSSTDNQNKSVFGEEALALVLTPNTQPVVRSMPKNNEAHILLIKRF